MRRALAATGIAMTAVLGFFSSSSCKYDPVPQEIIDNLGPEEGTPSSQHRPGQPCLVCHDAYGGASPAMAFAGTVYTTDAKGNIGPAAGVEISVLDWAGVPRKACSNLAGNFFLKKSDWKDPSFPLTVKAGGSAMTSLIGRDGSCGSCHKPTDPDGPAPHDPATGANFDSAGKILVDISATGQCQGAQ